MKQTFQHFNLKLRKYLILIARGIITQFYFCHFKELKQQNINFCFQALGASPNLSWRAIRSFKTNGVVQDKIVQFSIANRTTSNFFFSVLLINHRIIRHFIVVNSILISIQFLQDSLLVTVFYCTEKVFTM